ncbi:EXS family protein [Nitzschia inconspicua]|uniref:EXS family protein n=1 Tax=Nitzschia inconspicua TaxID=303405 RepID=A0A9K3PL04_9STRA|nr:EXS family protein [Nitzschia inconspicua]
MDITPPPQYLRRKAFLVPLLLVAFWLLSDNDTSLTAESEGDDNDSYYRSNPRHHLAIWTALHRHPPCLRIYRALLEFNLMLWGLALSLYVWQNTVGNKMIGHLLFQPVDHDYWKEQTVYFTEASKGKYRQLDQLDNDTKEEEDDETEKTPDNHDTDTDNTNAESVDDPSTNFECIIPPSALKIASVALDSLLMILISLFFFTLSSAEGGKYVDGMAKVHLFRFIAFVAAPIFPLLLFLGACLATVVPWKRQRQSQWLILSFTVGAPMYHVTFRDGFIGDVLTSSVRPMQDVAFTIFYLFSGLQGWWKQSYDLDAADLPLESNWLLHTFILPMCMISPLWWRFCQNLRQTYEYKQRWPYLGNALKYFVAAEVAVFGVYMQSPKESKVWLTAFVAATCYQIWWDVFMDWELLVISRWKSISIDLRGDGMFCVSFSLPLAAELRETRIYSAVWMYWGIFGLNILLRFCWTLSFLPPHYLNRAGVLSENFDGDLSAILNPTIASAEIVRRTLWGWLRVEWESIKVARQEPRLKGAWRDKVINRSMVALHDESLDISELHTNATMDLQAMGVEDLSHNEKPITRSLSYVRGWWIPRKMYDMTELQILGELCIYATIFTGLGLVAAAHRETL